MHFLRSKEIVLNRWWEKIVEEWPVDSFGILNRGN
jgi:hypothetical protein